MTRHRLVVDIMAAAAAVGAAWIGYRAWKIERMRTDPASYLGEEKMARLTNAKVELIKIDDPVNRPSDPTFRAAWDVAARIVGNQELDLLYGHGWSVAPDDGFVAPGTA